MLELTQTNTRDKQCVGVVFDVDTSNNDVSRLFFWHTGELLPNHYRSEGRCLTTAEMREYLQRSFTPEQFYCGPSNERFRRQLYDIYLGGLDMEKLSKAIQTCDLVPYEYQTGRFRKGIYLYGAGYPY